MGSKAFELLNIAISLLTHVFADIEAGDPAVKDIEAGLSALKAAASKADAAQ